MTIIVKLSVPDSLSEQAESVIKAFGYANRQELILEGFREVVHKKRLELLAMNLGKKPEQVLTVKQRQQIVAEYEASQRDLLKELGFEPREES